MKQMIWIRKENEETWSKIADKSAFVNSAIKNTFLPLSESVTLTFHEAEKQPGKPYVIKSKSKPVTAYSNVCIHGYNLLTSNCKQGCKKGK